MTLEIDSDLLASRHPAVADVAQWLLRVDPTLPAHLARIAGEFRTTARWLLETLPDGPELTVALRKLLEARDSAYRAAFIRFPAS